MKILSRLVLASVLVGGGALPAFAAEPTQLYWGDTHLHTSYSFDAFLNLNDSADPDTAYRWARGLPVVKYRYRLPSQPVFAPFYYHLTIGLRGQFTQLEPRATLSDQRQADYLLSKLSP